MSLIHVNFFGKYTKSKLTLSSSKTFVFEIIFFIHCANFNNVLLNHKHCDVDFGGKI